MRELISAADACMPAASISEASSVCLSLQSPYASRSTSEAARG
jgi:hypothetical protein